MSVLYPRLLPGETERLFRELQGRGPDELAKTADTKSARSVFAATGGSRVTTDALDVLRGKIRRIAEEQGYPSQARLAQRQRFDETVARLLHEDSGMTPGEASQRQVWAFLALVLVPDVCTWRFPVNTQGHYLADRFKGTDLTRHTLGRLWTRAHVLRDPAAPDDPYHLVGVLGESDLDQVMSRRIAIGATPALVRAVVRAHRDDPGDAGGVPSRPVLRDSLMRLLRLTAFMDMDALEESQLDDLVRGLRKEARVRLAGD
jgi:hypothetical protein